MSINDAANKLKTLAPMFRKFIEVGEALEKIGSLEDAEADAKARAQTARQAAEHEQANLALAVDGLKSAKGQARLLVDDADAKAAKIREAANADAAATAEQAKADAAKAWDHAKSEAGKREAEAKARLRELDERIQGTKAALATCDLELSSKRAELADLEKRIAAVRETAQKMLG
jgi:chromosome segregation ATPase